MKLAGAKRQQNCNWKLSKCDDVACPYCLHHPTTMAVEDKRVELNANKVARTTAIATPVGVGCHACEAKAWSGVPVVPGIMPGTCQWDCSKLCNCTYSVAFQQHHRIHIMNIRVKALEKEKQEAGGKSSAPLMTAVTTVTQKAELGQENIIKRVDHLIQYHTFAELEENQLDGGTIDYYAVKQNALSMTAIVYKVCA